MTEPVEIHKLDELLVQVTKELQEQQKRVRQVSKSQLQILREACCAACTEPANGIFTYEDLLQAHKALDERAAQLKEAEDSLAREKRQMTAQGTGDNDVLDLNVGGTLLSVKRSTLIQVKGSHLAAMFSGRWEQSLDRDSCGHIFLDFEPQCFQQILTFLRCQVLRPGQEVPAPTLAPDKLHAFTCLVDYLGLQEELNKAVKNTGPGKFAQLSSNAFLTTAMVDGQWADCAVAPAKGIDAFATSMPGMTAGHIYYIKVLPDKYSEKPPTYAFFGVVEERAMAKVDVELPSSFAQDTYGWKHQIAWRAGSQFCSAPYSAPSAGLMYILQLDLQSGQLACVQPSSTEAGWKIPVPIPDSDKSFSFCFTLTSGSETKLLPVTVEDQQHFADTTLFRSDIRG